MLKLEDVDELARRPSSVVVSAAGRALACTPWASDNENNCKTSVIKS